MADRIITYRYAAANFDAFKKQTIPINDRAMTKEKVLEYINADTDILNGYPLKRLVPRIKVQGMTQSLYYDFNNVVLTIGVQSDNKIIVGGKFTSYRGTAVNQIVRLNTNGTLDTSFDTGVGFTTTSTFTQASVAKVIIQSDGKILVGGTFNSYKSVSKGCIMRLNTDGSLDTTFNGGISVPVTGGLDGEVTSMHMFDNSYYIGCRLSNFIEGRTYKCNMNGTLVSGFNYNNNTSIAYGITNDGSYIYIGGLRDGSGFVYKINKTTGTIMSPYAVTNGLNFGGAVYGLIYQASTAKLIAVGNFNSYYPPGATTHTAAGSKICRINPSTGLIDEAFRTNIYASLPIGDPNDVDTFITVSLDSNDNILIGGFPTPP